MTTITYRVVKEDNIDFLRDLCNGLMNFQAEHATIRQDIMASMNFDNRLKPEFKNDASQYMVVAYDKEKPVGFAFASTEVITEKMVSSKTGFAKALEGVGFYPKDFDAPKKIGTFKMLFVDASYRNHHIGWELSNRAMAWLKAQEDVEELWVYVANGNDIVGKFYEKYGFEFSHDVFQGFITAYHQLLT